MEALTLQQSNIGANIKGIVTNYIKDPADRKTLAYYQQRLRRLNDAWDAFETTDNQIRTKYGDQRDHPYFVQDYYDAVRRIYEEYSKIFQEKLAEIAESTRNESGNDAAGKKSAAASKQNNTGSGKMPSSSCQNPKESLNTEGDSSVVHTKSGNLLQTIRKQRVTIESLTRLLNRLEQDGRLDSKQACEEKAATIKRFWEHIESWHYNISELTDEPESEGYDVTGYYDLEEKVHEVQIKLAEKLATLSSPIIHTPATAMMQLPKVVLPKFDGNYLEWQQFHDLFKQMVHNQPLGPCQKMWYLKTHLSGEAEKLIRHLSLSDENYSAAWEMLTERYNNHRLLVTALINKLLSQPSVSSEGASAIKALHDTTQECLMGLQNLGVDTTNWDPLLFHFLSRKLDQTTHGLYEQSLSQPKKLPKLKDFLIFIETRFQSLEALGGKNRSTEGQTKRAPSKSFTSTITQNQLCPSCKGTHQLFACQDFLQMAPPKRLQFLKASNLCINCLRHGHTVSRCMSRGCSKCSKKHNTLVHLEKELSPGQKPKQPQANKAQAGVTEKNSNV